jgi:hypothetical protein
LAGFYSNRRCSCCVCVLSQMLGQLKEEYRIEAPHNTVQAWIDYREWSRFPAEWDVNIARLIREAHNVGLPIGVAYGYHVGDSVDGAMMKAWGSSTTTVNSYPMSRSGVTPTEQ